MAAGQNSLGQHFGMKYRADRQRVMDRRADPLAVGIPLGGRGLEPVLDQFGAKARRRAVDLPQLFCLPVLAVRLALEKKET